MLIKVFFSAVSIDPHLNFITPRKGLFAIAVFLTFYTVDRPDNTVCSDELEHYGIRGLALEWISYFSYRMQYVQFNDHRSLKNWVSYGFPQGSISGPLFFLVNINDFISASSTLNFANEMYFCHIKIRAIF